MTYLSTAEQRQFALPESPAVPGAPAALPAPAAGSVPPAEPAQAPAPANVTRDDVVHIGGSPVTVKQNERVRGDVVSVGGAVDVDGEVTGDVVAVMGKVTLGPHAVVRGDVTAVGSGLPFNVETLSYFFRQIWNSAAGTAGWPPVKVATRRLRTGRAARARASVLRAMRAIRAPSKVAAAKRIARTNRRSRSRPRTMVAVRTGPTPTTTTIAQ